MTENNQAGPSAPAGEAAPQNQKPPEKETESIGIKLEEMAVQLSKKHATKVDPDNPILMVASICNAFLGEIKKLHAKQNVVLSKILSKRTQELVFLVRGSDPKDPQLPDGIGTRLEDMAVLLAMKHGVHVPLEDPLLMVLSICNSFLVDIQNLNNKHSDALGKIITSRTQEYVASVKATTETFSQAVSTASVEGIRQVFAEHAAALHSATWNARWCALISAAGALSILIALIAR